MTSRYKNVVPLIDISYILLHKYTNIPSTTPTTLIKAHHNFFLHKMEKKTIVNCIHIYMISSQILLQFYHTLMWTKQGTHFILHLANALLLRSELVSGHWLIKAGRC